MQEPVKKTWGREVATTLVVWLFGLATYLIITGSETVGVQIVTMLGTPVFLFLSYAFGAKVYQHLKIGGSKP